MINSKFLKKQIRSSIVLETSAYVLQNILNINNQGYGNYGSSEEDIYNHFIQINQKYLKQLGKDAFIGKTVLELGTGVSLCGMLALAKEYDVRKIYCYDRFNCLNANDHKIISQNNLEQYLPRLKYLYGPIEILKENIDINSVDTICSNAVLEFVPNMLDLFIELKRILKKNGQMYHEVDLRCHNKFLNHGELYFHKFSEIAWKLMGSRVGQLNRLRVCDYEDIFKKLEFDQEFNNIEFDNTIMQKASTYLKNINLEKLKYQRCKVVLKNKK